MLVLCFTAEGLLRVRFAPGPAPPVEPGLALAVLRAGRPARPPRWTSSGGAVRPGMG
jgi:hypothetical protein